MELAVDHYLELLSADVLPSDAFCLTAVRGLTVDEAIERFDGYPGWAVADLAEVGHRAIVVYPDDLPTVVADEVDGWVLLAENNGWHGVRTSALQRLSAGTVAASAFWNVNLDSRNARPRLARMRLRHALRCRRRIRLSRSHRRCTTPVRPIGRDGLPFWQR